MAETRTSDALVCTDQAATHDRLGLGPYGDTLVEVIRRAETPLTVGINGRGADGVDPARSRTRCADNG